MLMNRKILFRNGALTCVAILCIGNILVGCQADNDETAGEPTKIQSLLKESGEAGQEVRSSFSGNPLAGTDWRLAGFQSMDDTTGTMRPFDPSLYTMHLDSDGTVTMHLDCNVASGTWSVKPDSNAESGRFEFGSLATTRAFCPPPSMDEIIEVHARHINAYLLKDGKLYLSVKTDGGIVAWEPIPGKSLAAGVPATPEKGGPRNWEVTEVSTTLNLREQPSTASRILASYAPGTILDNLGCQRAEARVWCNVKQVGGGPRGYVSAEFLMPAVLPRGRVTKGSDD